MITSSVTTLQECPVNLCALHEAAEQVQAESKCLAGVLSALVDQQEQAMEIKFWRGTHGCD